jgi:hypothetical protein
MAIPALVFEAWTPIPLVDDDDPSTPTAFEAFALKLALTEPLEVISVYIAVSVP